MPSVPKYFRVMLVTKFTHHATASALKSPDQRVGSI